jgi:hypothetical protein
MPLSAVIPLLAQGFQALFDVAPPSSADAASLWASAYCTWCLAGGAAVLPPRQQALSNALATAFEATAGAGAAGLVSALATFWPGTPVPGMAPTAQAVAFIPWGDLSLVVPGVNDAPAAAQAQGLAQLIAALTLASVKVLIPPSPLPVPIV